MQLTFCAEVIPNENICQTIENCSPTNPFYTSNYMDSMRRLGYVPSMLYLEEDNQFISGCIGLMKYGRINRTLLIDSLPNFEDRRTGDTFWIGLFDFL